MESEGEGSTVVAVVVEGRLSVSFVVAGELG